MYGSREDAEEELSQIATEDAGPEMNNIIQRFYEINAQLKDKMYREKADELFKCIPMKMELFYDKFAKECNNIPIFKYYDPFQIFQNNIFFFQEESDAYSPFTKMYQFVNAGYININYKPTESWDILIGARFENTVK